MNVKKSALPSMAIVITGLLIGLLLKLFVIDILHVSGTSMVPALQDGSIIIADKLAYGLTLPNSSRLLVQWADPKPGDIVIYLYNNKIVVKRCVAVGGTTLEYSTDPVYTLHVGDKSITLSKRQYNRMRQSTSVPDGYILTIGDNYSVSVDSRTYGFVSKKCIIGKIVCR